VNSVSPDPSGITDEMIELGAQAIAEEIGMRGQLYPVESPDFPAHRRRIAEVVLTAALAGRTVVDNPAPLAFQDEHSDVKTWEPDGVDFQVNFHPADSEKDAEVSFAYWQISPQQARVLGEVFIAAGQLGDQASGVAGGGAQ
jgi:hypothetical protein